MDPLREPDKIAFAGDWHGNLGWAVWAIDYAARQQRADVIVHTGDFGYKFDRRYLDVLDAGLNEYGLPLLFVDGNHDHQKKLAKYPMQSNGLRQLRDHIFFMPRGFRWTWNGKQWLALGGAYSVDRAYRDRVTSDAWWPEEELTKAQVLKAMKDGPTDVMITHDCPSGVDIPGVNDKQGTAQFGRAAILGANRHRHQLRAVVDKVKPKLIVHGHYHKRYELTVDLGYGPVDVIGLDCDGSNLEANVKILMVDRSSQ